MTAERGTAPFHIEGADFDSVSGEIRLRYSFEGGERFVERIVMPVPSDAAAASTPQMAAALRILLLVAGTSYYKSAAPSEVVIDDPAGITDAEAAMLAALYDEGLREFAWRNALDIPLVNSWNHTRRPDAAVTAPATEGIHRPIVPFGGGKDSTVVLALLDEATPITVNPTSHHRDLAARMGHEVIEVRRIVDRVDLLTDPTSFNGHIPITAIVSAISVFYAALWGAGDVVMANEAAASEPTMWTPGGDAVNHQYSKSAAFERLFRDALATAGVGVRYFSLLRDLAESDVIALLAARRELIGNILSCNNAFRGLVDGRDEVAQAWCGHCPKCCFTFLMLAEVLPPDEVVTIFGADLLDRPELTDAFADLWNEAKPFECVGERRDAAGAMVHLAASPQWGEHAVVVATIERARAELAEASDPAERDSGANIPAAYFERRAAALSSIASQG